MRLHMKSGFQLAIAQYFDQVILARQTVFDQQFRRDIFFAQPGQTLQIEDPVLGPENVGEAALGHAAMQRHLPAFKTAHHARTGAGTLALVAARRSLAHAAAHAPAHAFLIRRGALRRP